MSRHARDDATDPGQWFRVVAGKPGPDERLFFRIPVGDMGGWSSIVDGTPGPGPIVVGTPHDRYGPAAARTEWQDIDHRVIGFGWVLR